MPLLQPEETLLVATHNAGKLAEIRELTASVGLRILSATDKGLPEPEETGDTFEANALLKAQSGAAHASGYPVLADDSGLAVDALDGAPGIYSARWGGEKKNFTHAMQRVQQELQAKGVDPQGQPASFICVLALARDGHAPVTFRGEVKGHLRFPADGSAGFGYDPIFVPEGHTETFAQMDASHKRSISHRTNAFAQFLTYVKGQVAI